MTFPLPQFIQLYPTHRCNQNCSFCFNASTENPKDLTCENAHHLLDIMLNLHIPDLDIMGGEPFLLPWMPSFLHTAINKGIMVNISTNGSFPGIMKEFRKVSPEKINIGISLEGCSAETHNRLTCSLHFEKALASITELVSLGLNPLVKTVVSRATMPEIQSIADLLKKLGVRRYYLIHMDLLTTADSCGMSAVSYTDFLDFFHEIRSANTGIEINRVNASCFEKTTLPKGVRCAGGVRKFSIMPDGSAYPCNLFQHFPEFCLGNIFSDGLADIWMNPKLDYFRRFEKNACRVTECSNLVSCTGSCPAHGYFHHLDINGTDIRCMSRL